MAGKCYLRVLSQDSDLNYDVQIACLRSGVNRNKLDFRNVEQYASTFRGVPILCAYLTNGKVGDGHNMAEKRLPGGEVVYDFTGPNHERIVGAIGDRPDDVWTEVRDDQVWVIARGKLWRFYNWQLVDKIAEQGRMEVSAETEVFEEYEDGDVSVFTSWRALGLTILGDSVMPAVPGANIRELKELQAKFADVRVAAASYHPESNDPKPHNNTKKEGVKKSMYLSKAQLNELQKKFGDNYAVLATTQTGDDMRVLLMRQSDHVFGIYSMTARDSVIDPERIADCGAQIIVKMDEDGEICVSASDVISEHVRPMTERIAELTAGVEKLNSDLETAMNTVKSMQSQENQRRMSAAKEIAKQTLAAFNANRDDLIADSVISGVEADIDSGLYTNSVNADGVWVGNKAVEEKVLSLCAAEQMKLDQTKAKHRNSTFIMDKLGTGAAADDGSVQGLLARKGIQ